MKLKYYLRGLGIGIILTTIILSIAFSDRNLTDEQIIEKAKSLGMVMKEESIFQDKENSEVMIKDENRTTEEPSVVSEMTETEQTTEEKGTHYRLIIPKGAVPRIICEELAENGIIEDAEEFRSFLVKKKYTNSIWPGEYDIPYETTYEEIYQILKAGPK